MPNAVSTTCTSGRCTHPTRGSRCATPVMSTPVVASSPDEKDAFFEPSGDKVYRHPTFYDIPDDVPHL